MVNYPDNYCAAPFVAMRLNQGGKGWTPCCAWQCKPGDPIIPQDDPDPFNHPGFDEIRRRMLAGETIPSCVLCTDSRRDGVPVSWDKFNQTYGRTDVPSLRYVEVSFGNLCNLRCRMCDSGSSSRWVADEIRLGKTPVRHQRWSTDRLAIQAEKIETLRVAGGEPLMEQDNLIKLLERIHSVQGGLHNLEFDMVSNATIEMRPRLLELLGQCKKVYLQTSLDGLAAVNTYQRTGSDFSEIERHARIYDGMVCDAFGHSVACSLGILNIDGFMDFADWVSEELPSTNLIIQPIYYPAWQALHNLPPAIKDELAAEVSRWSPKRRFHLSGFDQDVLRLLQPPCGLDAATILREIARLDALTDESFAEVQPRMHAALVSSLTC